MREIPRTGNTALSFSAGRGHCASARSSCLLTGFAVPLPTRPSPTHRLCHFHFLPSFSPLISLPLYCCNIGGVMSLCVYASSLYLRSQMLDTSNSRPAWAYCVCISRALRDSKDWIRVMTLSLRSLPHKPHSSHPQTHLGFMVLNETCSRRKGPRG